MLRLLEILVLQSQADLVGFDGPDRARDLVCPGLHVEIAQFAIGAGGVARVVLGETGIPSDAGKRAWRQILSLQIGRRFGSGAIQVKASMISMLTIDCGVTR